MRNLYEVLGVDPAVADKIELKSAYHKRAKTLHPDAGGSAKAFAELQEAYAILSDPRKRKQYDEDGTIDHRANNERALVIECAAKMLDNYLSQVANGFEASVIHIDVVEAMRAQIRNQIADISHTVAKMQTTCERLEKFAQRFSAKKGKSILRIAIDAKVAAIRSAVPLRTQEADKLEAVLELLSDQEFRFDPTPQVFNWLGPTSTIP